MIAVHLCMALPEQQLCPQLHHRVLLLLPLHTQALGLHCLRAAQLLQPLLCAKIEQRHSAFERSSRCFGIPQFFLTLPQREGGSRVAVCHLFCVCTRLPRLLCLPLLRQHQSERAMVGGIASAQLNRFQAGLIRSSSSACAQ